MPLEFRVPKPDGSQKAFCSRWLCQVPLFSKCVGLALVQKVFCRFHRRCNATLFKALDIGCSICVLQPLAALNVTLLQGASGLRKFKWQFADFIGKVMQLGLRFGHWLFNLYFAAVGCAECHFTSRCVKLAQVQMAFCRFHRRGNATLLQSASGLHLAKTHRLMAQN